MEFADLKGPVARLLRDGNPNSVTNKKLIAAGRTITEELRRRLEEKFPTDNKERKLPLGGCHACRGTWLLVGEPYQWKGVDQKFDPFQCIHHHFSEMIERLPRGIYQMQWSFSHVTYAKPDAHLLAGIHHLAMDIVAAGGYEKWREEKFRDAAKYLQYSVRT